MPSPQQARWQEADEKLKEMQDQVDKGKLVIRQMTPEERLRYPPPKANGPAKRSKG